MPAEVPLCRDFGGSCQRIPNQNVTFGRVAVTEFSEEKEDVMYDVLFPPYPRRFRRRNISEL